MELSRHSGASRLLTVCAVSLSLIWTLTYARVAGTGYPGESPPTPGNVTSSDTQTGPGGNRETPGSVEDSPYEDLARVLGIGRVPLHLRHHSPPEYFHHLFKSTADAEGVAVGPAPYHADTVMGYLDKERGSQSNYKYNITNLDPTSQLLNADFHLYRLRRLTSIRSKRSARFIILKLYVVMNPARRHTPYGNRLIDIRRVVANQHGWVVFNVKEAVSDWVANNGRGNYGFLVTAQNQDGSAASTNLIRFAQKGQHHDRLQPCVALYTSKKGMQQPNMEETPLTRAFDQRDPNRYDNIYHRLYYVPPMHTRTRRSANQWGDTTSSGEPYPDYTGYPATAAASTSYSSNPDPRLLRPVMPTYCSRHTMLVDFVQMGWDQWIISPTRFNARVCSGPCPFPLGQAYHPTNHAVVQSIWHHLRPGNTLVRQPCCVPHSLNALNMLYYDEEFKVVLKSYDNMVVTSCGCK